MDGNEMEVLADVFEHLCELEEAWMRGTIRECDGQCRANRNYELRGRLQRILPANRTGPKPRFKIGDRVKFNGYAASQGLIKRSSTGVVKRIKGSLITVHLDGYKQPSRYHHSFFDRVAEAPHD